MACLPTQWADMRQTHLPKEFPSEETPGALPDDKFRPISVSSAWHRTWATARFKSECCSAWLSDWWDNDMVGARRHREAAEAVVMAATNTNCNEYCTSWDYSLAFDMCHPDVAAEAFDVVGMPGN
eukprot:4006968-Pyramimonas_sp.AAC.1